MSYAKSGAKVVLYFYMRKCVRQILRIICNNTTRNMQIRTYHVIF